MGGEPQATPQSAVVALQSLGGRIIEDEGIVQLIDLSESHAEDSDLHWLLAFPHVRSLVLSDTSVTSAGLKIVGQMTTLETLDLSTTQVTDEGLQHLANLARLNMLILGGCRVRDRGLSSLRKLSNLHILILSDTDVTDTGLAELAEMTQLRDLNLDYTQVTDAGLTHLANFKNLELLGLVFCKGVTDAGLAFFRDLENLHVLDVGTTLVTSEGVADLQRYLPDCFIAYSPDPLLEALEKHNGDLMAALSTIGKVELGASGEITKLRIDQAQLTRAGLEYLKRFGQLQDLGIYHHRQLAIGITFF